MSELEDILFENTLTKGLIIININIKLQTKFMYGFTLLSGKIISTIFIIKAPTIIEMNEYSKLYVDSYNDLANKTNNESLSKGYEDGLKAVLQLKLDEYGYELDDLKMNGSEIETIKIKEKNSNNDNKKDIQSNDTEKEEEVFKSSSELNLKEGKIKEDLIKVLNISIGDIEID